MASEMIAALTDRGVICVAGADASAFLQGLLTNDLSDLAARQAVYAGLLSPQGKILFEMLAVKTSEGFLLDVDQAKCADLVKRLTMYKLRAKVEIKDVSAEYVTLALWGEEPARSGDMLGSVSFRDPRSADLGSRILAEAALAADIAAATKAADSTPAAYHAHRIALGVPEGGKDYDFGDAYPHEANFDLFNGVSFTKGCYVGQEVVARMQNKTVVRKRVVKVTASAALTCGASVLLGETAIGRIGSVDGAIGLAMLRLDRVAEAAEKNISLNANGIAITVDSAPLNRYHASIAARPAAPSFP